MFFFNGHRVDESEVVLNALTIATGDWNPTWSPGYGHLAMYLPAIVLASLAALMYATGSVASYADGLYLLFADDAVYRVTRLLYTLADVGTALLFSLVVVRVTARRGLAVACFAYFLISPDTWQYANYIRTDTLVSFFIAAAVYLLATRRTRATPWLLGAALAAAIACKYSAVVYLALIGCLLLPDRDDPEDGPRKRLVAAVTAGVVALVATFVFQPKFDYSGILAGIDTHLSGSHFTSEEHSLTERWTRLGRQVLELEPLAPWLALLALPVLARPRRAAPVLLAAFLGIAPFALSNFPREYWLIPFADALRGAGWLGLAVAVDLAGVRIAPLAGRVVGGLAIAAVLVIGVGRMPSLAKDHAVSARLSNVEAAKRWLYVHAVNRRPVVYAYEKNYLLPRAYSFADYDEAARFSRVFIFHREDFGSLHDLFRKRLYREEFSTFGSMTAVPHLEVSLDRAHVGDGEPELCIGKGCYRPNQRKRCAVGPETCTTYGWNMDRPALGHDLSALYLKMPPEATDFAACWYTCRSARPRPVHVEHSGTVPLLRISGALFAPATVKGFASIRDSARAGTFVVTSPVAFQSWVPKRERTGSNNRATSEDVERLLGARLVKYFDAGSGPAIHVYERRDRPAR